MASNITLSELNLQIKDRLKNSFPKSQWVIAEINEINENSKGHCYLELIEKDTQTDYIIARARATIWAYTYRLLKPYFETTSNTKLQSGLKVLIQAKVEFHELYGYSLNIKDIDPAYTLGDLARLKMETIIKLKEDGVFQMNKELPKPYFPSKIAIISSKNAAGYQDFIHQLQHNPFGYVFYTKLFPAIVQGNDSPGSIIHSLDEINRHISFFDLLVVIRGGGSQTDLNSFNNYLLSSNIAQFPIPVITGIGHEKDESVCDMVAHHSFKTPTAVAEYLINSCQNLETYTQETRNNIIAGITQILENEKKYLDLKGSQLIPLLMSSLLKESRHLSQLAGKARHTFGRAVHNKHEKLTEYKGQFNFLLKEFLLNFKHKTSSSLKNIRDTLRQKINDSHHQISIAEKTMQLLDPANILMRGYSITYCDGEIIKNSKNLEKGKTIITKYAQGESESKISRIK
ncbi:MAG: exodeoxyribonuclease VII large subunit [Bacteroidota bacterium]|nr:exodeoxyribonuclease VII large subunit [Bacteroidota bacterium]